VDGGPSPIGVKITLDPAPIDLILKTMQAASLALDSFPDLLSRLPPELDLDVLAVSTNAIKRRREVGNGETLLRLALARGPGGLSLSQTVTWASMQGLATLSDPGLKYRLDKAVPFLKALLEQQLAERSGSIHLRWPGRFLCAVDGSSIKQPGRAGQGWRVHAAFDLGGGGFSHLELTDTHGAESADRGPPTAGEIRIGDRNYANAGALHRWRERSGGTADFIVRARWKGFVLSRLDGAAFSLMEHLSTLPVDDRPHEISVRAKVSKREHLPLRLIIQRKSAEETAQIQDRLRRSAPRKQKTLDPRSLIAAEFLIVATSLPADGYAAGDVLAAYRLRWQIELAFKRLKSLLHIDQLPTRTPDASRSWLYAHMILALVCDDLSQDFLEFFPSGPG
jgi:hypothetical protein